MGHYFDADPVVASRSEVVDVVLGDVGFTMRTDRGVFSHGRLDTGTSLLLHRAPAPASTGHLLDLGCGAGPIALTMALRSPAATVWAIDVNARARELTAANAERNGVTEKLSCLQPGEFNTRGADIVLANILAGPLIGLAPVITGCARPGGSIVLSGLLEEQVDEVVKAYASTCLLEDITVREGWARAVLVRT